MVYYRNTHRGGAVSLNEETPFRVGIDYAVDDETGCWLWLRARNAQGYPNVKIDSVTRLPHRLAYEAAHGFIPDGFHVHHRCHTRHCINPEHLEALSPTEHALMHVKRKLAESDVLNIREGAARAESNRTLAQRFNVSEDTISEIVSRSTWAHVGGPTTMLPRTCPGCGEPLTGQRNQRTCGVTCRSRVFRAKLAA